jgi:hypothetical protein
MGTSSLNGPFMAPVILDAYKAVTACVYMTSLTVVGLGKNVPDLTVLSKAIEERSALGKVLRFNKQKAWF